MDTLLRLFPDLEFMPHGHCYYWLPSLVALNVISDGLIALAYYSIPITLVYFVSRRRNLTFSWMFVCFAIFILACGTTHAMEIWNIWHADYWLSGIVKAITALVSIPTAILLVRLVPAALKLRGPDELKRINDELEREIADRVAAEQDLQRVNARLKAEIDERIRTAEQLNQAAELELFNRIMVGRELRMIELKREVNELAKALNRPLPYDIVG